MRRLVAATLSIFLTATSAHAGACAFETQGDGHVTEGTSSNAWIVTAKGEIVTHPATHAILDGITRQGLIAVIKEAGLNLIERPFSLAEAKAWAARVGGESAALSGHSRKGCTCTRDGTRLGITMTSRPYTSRSSARASDSVPLAPARRR